MSGEGSLQSDDTPIVSATMANDEDLQLFLQDVQHWNANMNPWDTGRHFAASGGHQRDLSGTRIGALLVQRAEREQGRSVEQATEYPAADLSFTNLARTDFRNPYASFNLQEGEFPQLRPAGSEPGGRRPDRSGVHVCKLGERRPAGRHGGPSRVRRCQLDWN